MIDLSPLVNDKASFTLLLAPPAWGKTQLILHLFREEVDKIVFISPLRALANEFFKQAQIKKSVFMVERRSEGDDIYRKFLSKRSALLIVTPEVLSEQFLMAVEELSVKPLFILDEFHLFYYWGESFRPILWETCMGVANTGASILALSATMTTVLLNRWRSDFSCSVNNRYLIDVGNQTLKNYPTRIYCFKNIKKRRFNHRFVYQLRKDKDKDKKEVLLYFCRYRSEVFRWLEFCRREYIPAIGCVGGEVAKFQEDLEKSPYPRCIFATSVLSHGVNLPSISKVFISYPVKNRDFWIQMVGRGGRRGEMFEIYTFDSYLISLRQRIIGGIKIIFFDFITVLHLYWLRVFF